MIPLSAVTPPSAGASSGPSVRRRLRNGGIATGEAGNEQGEFVDLASLRPGGDLEDTDGEDGDGQE